MPYTIEDFRRDFTKEHLGLLSPKERIEGLSLPEMEAVSKELQRQIEQSKAGGQAGKRPGPRSQKRTGPNRPSSRRKRKET